jgi:glycosyltransferase involved in cell wall biosynthesis
MRVAIVVPYSWSYPGGVVEHAADQCQALEALGVETVLVAGFDPRGRLTRLIHRGVDARGEAPPRNFHSLGRSVVVPGNGSLPKLIISPKGMYEPRRLLRASAYDLIHVHEPLTPIPAAASLAWAQVPVVATFHAGGASKWRGGAARLWGFLLDRIDYRIAVSSTAMQSAQEYLPGDYEVIPNGISTPGDELHEERDHTVVFIGRSDPRKGLQHLLDAWPSVYEQTGARLRLIGIEQSEIASVLARNPILSGTVDTLGSLYNDDLTREVARAKVLVAPSEGSESFGMVLTRAYSCGTPVVASDISGYREIVTPETGWLTPPGDARALSATIVEALSDEPRRRLRGAAAEELARTHYSWADIASRLESIYEAILRGAEPTPRGTDDADELPGLYAGAASARARQIPLQRWLLWHLTLVGGILVFWVFLTGTAVVRRAFRRHKGHQRTYTIDILTRDPELAPELEQRPQQQQHILLVNEDGTVTYVAATLGPLGVLEVSVEDLRAVLVTSAIDHIEPARLDLARKFEEILSLPGVREQDLQQFLEEHQEFLLGDEYEIALPQVVLPIGSAKSLRPDFILKPIKGVTRDATIVELKLPGQNILKKRHSHQERLYAAIYDGVQQLRDYQRYFRDEVQRNAFTQDMGFDVYRPQLALVVGRQQNFPSNAALAKILEDLPPVDIMSYDDLIVRYRQRFRR